MSKTGRNILIIVLGVACGMGAVFGYKSLVSAFDSLALNGISVSGPVTASAFAQAVGAPQELIIPKINVDAPVMDVGVAADGDLGVPNDAVHVAWYKNGPRPGEPGAAVIDGHLDTIHSPQAVFYNLGTLQAGDKVEILTGSGQMLTFKVTKVETVPYDAQMNDLFTTSSPIPELNLVTCAGDWMPSKKLYNQRLVVFSQLVSVSSSTASSS